MSRDLSRLVEQQIAKALETKSADLAKVAATNDQSQIRRAFGEMAKTCSACHSDYRKAKN